VQMYVMDNMCTASVDEGHAHAHTEDVVVKLMVDMRVLRCTCNGDDVIKAHGEIGHDDGLDGGHDGGTARDVAVFVFFGCQQLDADPDEQQAAHDFEKRNIEQNQRERNEQHTQHNGARGAPYDAAHALLLGQVATGQRDHDRIVATQKYVDKNNLKQGPPMKGREEVKH